MNVNFIICLVCYILRAYEEQNNQWYIHGFMGWALLDREKKKKNLPHILTDPTTDKSLFFLSTTPQVYMIVRTSLIFFLRTISCFSNFFYIRMVEHVAKPQSRETLSLSTFRDRGRCFPFPLSVTDVGCFLFPLSVTEVVLSLSTFRDRGRLFQFL